MPVSDPALRSCRRRSIAILATATAATLLLAACGTSNMSGGQHSMPGSSGTSAPTTADHSAPSMPGMPGMDHSAAGNGLSATESGLTLQPGSDSLPAGQDTTWTYRIVAGADGKPVTQFQPEQTKLMHLYVVRSDLTGFEHIHPTMAPDGTWTANLTALQPGSFRIYTQFTTTAPDGAPVTPVLSVPVTVPGAATPVPLPAATPSTEVDGYTVAVNANVRAGADGELSLTFSRDGQPVTDLQPYLNTYAHVTAIHAGDLAFAHLHPSGTVNGDPGGPRLDFRANLPQAGPWRLFIQFQTAGVLHTAQITVPA